MTLAVLTCIRTIAGNDPITFQVALAGTAVLGTHYQIVSGVNSTNNGILTITIAAGQASKDIVIDSLPGAIASAKTVIFTIIDSAGVVGITPKTKTLTLYPTPVGDVFDQMVLIPELGYSLSRRLRSTYTGAAFRIKKAGANLEQDINFLPSGAIDSVALLTIIGNDTWLIKTVYNQGSVAGANLTQSNAANMPVIAENGTLMTRHNRLAMRQRLAQHLVIPTLTTFGSGARSFTINYIAGMEGNRNERIVSSISPADNALYGFWNNRYRAVFANGVGSIQTPPSQPFVLNQRQWLRQSSFSTPTTLNLPIILYQEGLAYQPQTPTPYLSGDLGTNGTPPEQSDCYFSEFVMSGQGVSWLSSLQKIELSQRRWFGLATAQNDYFGNVFCQLDFQNTNSPVQIDDWSLLRSGIRLSGAVVIDITTPQFGLGCLLLGTSQFEVQFPNLTVEYEIQAYEDFTFQLGIRPIAALSGNSTLKVILRALSDVGLAAQGGNFIWTQGASTIIAAETGRTIPDNVYTHVAVSRAGGLLKIWRNGVVTATANNYNSGLDLRNGYLGRPGSWLAGTQWEGRIGYVRLMRGAELDLSVVPINVLDYNTFN